MDTDIGLGVDTPQAFGHGIGFGAAILAGQGMELSVGIGNADVVHINQRQGANAGASQGFRCPRADTAQANNGNMGVTEALQGPAAIQSLDTAKAEVEIVTRHAVSPRKSPDCNPGLPAVSNGWCIRISEGASARHKKGHAKAWPVSKCPTRRGVGRTSSETLINVISIVHKLGGR